MKRKTKNYLLLSSILAFILFWTVLLFIVSPDKIVRLIGVKNTYLMLFLVSALGGFSSFTAVSIYSIMVTFIGGGSMPFFIGISAGTGITVGDSLIYYFGSIGRKVLTGKSSNIVKKMSQAIEGKPKFVIPMFVYIYAAFTPFPNDIMVIAVSLIGYPLRKAIVPLLAGNVTLMLLLSYGISYGWKLF